MAVCKVPMDWSGCGLVEVIPEKVSGRQIVKGTRIPADVIVSSYESGLPVEEIEENYPSLWVETINGLLSFARVRHLQTAS